MCCCTCLTAWLQFSLRVVLWSIGTVFQRGKGLPFGWLGLLGFAEALQACFVTSSVSTKNIAYSDVVYAFRGSCCNHTETSPQDMQRLKKTGWKGNHQSMSGMITVSHTPLLLNSSWKQSGLTGTGVLGGSSTWSGCSGYGLASTVSTRTSDKATGYVVETHWVYSAITADLQPCHFFTAVLQSLSTHSLNLRNIVTVFYGQTLNLAIEFLGFQSLLLRRRQHSNHQPQLSAHQHTPTLQAQAVVPVWLLWRQTLQCQN